jgi:hypothetical protein
MFKWTEFALAFGFFNNTNQLDPMLFNLLLEERRMKRAALVAAAQASKLAKGTTGEACNDASILDGNEATAKQDTANDKKAA